MTQSGSEGWIKDLEDNGWKKYKNSPTTWIAPCGCIYRGPYSAWVILKMYLGDKNLRCPNHSEVM